MSRNYATQRYKCLLYIQYTYCRFVIVILAGPLAFMHFGARMHLREDTHKKSVFFSGRTTKVLSSLHHWVSAPCHFFLFLPNLWAKTAGF